LQIILGHFLNKAFPVAVLNTPDDIVNRPCLDEPPAIFFFLNSVKGEHDVKSPVHITLNRREDIMTPCIVWIFSDFTWFTEDDKLPA
jgi:hypothetical protein